MGPRLDQVKSLSRRLSHSRRASSRKPDKHTNIKSSTSKEDTADVEGRLVAALAEYSAASVQPFDQEQLGDTMGSQNSGQVTWSWAPEYVNHIQPGSSSLYTGGTWNNPVDLTMATPRSNQDSAEAISAIPSPFVHSCETDRKLTSPLPPLAPGRLSPRSFELYQEPSWPPPQPLSPLNTPHSIPATNATALQNSTDKSPAFVSPSMASGSHSFSFPLHQAASFIPELPSNLDNASYFMEQILKDEELAQALQLQYNQELVDASATGKETDMDIGAAPLSDSTGHGGFILPNVGFDILPDPCFPGHPGTLAPDAPTEMEIDTSSRVLSPPPLSVTNEDEEDWAEIPEEEQICLEQLRQYTRSLNVPCAACSRRITTRQEDIPDMTRKWVASTEPSQSWGFASQHISPLSLPSTKISVGGMEFLVYYCCDGGREFALWALACGWEQFPSRSLKQAVVNKLRSHRSQTTWHTQGGSPSHARHSRNLFHRTPIVAKGTGYGGADAWSMPFGPGRRQKAVNTIIAPKPLDAKEDLAHEAYFRLVSVLLPSLNAPNPTNMDMMPPIHLSTMLARSPLMTRAAVMLTNDSIDDISKQHSLYDGMLDFVNALGCHTATAGLIYNQRQIFTKSGSMLNVSFRKDGQKTKVTPRDTGKSLADLLSRLATQGRTLRQHAQHNQHDFMGKNETDLLLWAERVVQISAFHQANSQQFKANEMDIDGGKGKKPATLSWSEYHREHAVREIEDDRILHNHYFSKQGSAAATSLPPKGRMKRLITEISTLQTSLPEGIFVIHGSSRLDVMKFLIIGPKGTPYEYGFFEFDLYCPVDYPSSPPKVQFKTTGGGKIRFNPNLYDDGKGTWSGEPWRSDHSTILQVLVSIQSMILCENPWYNEPGREMNESKGQSTKYNNEVRSWTIQYAIYPWASAISATTAHPEQTQQVSSAWRSLAQTHLRIFGREIDSISSAAARNSKFFGLEASARSLHEALDKQGYLA
ncbi:hypothetical protein JX265_013489 [Neoarthrinium moseri]|uniref:UBC core domain-containing protein n=1 Tax=Neoarthrinium moseri TaxID=1658444 RepID=A0A9Q0AHN4_9PEZI|nr:hypothetical protein JX265_013489 [Neoarthrinium moseri]